MIQETRERGSYERSMQLGEVKIIHTDGQIKETIYPKIVNDQNEAGLQCVVKRIVCRLL